jgi:pseudouridine-5'-phosphate glycosidase
MKLQVASEVREALVERRPVVALESSVIAQGLPHPENLQAAQACEEAVRRGGAVPATVAVLEGQIRVGLSSREIQLLATPGSELEKIASRDLAVALGLGQTGGTTVSATCEIAAAAGIRVLATGGIGGVHRHFAERMDISQDLQALARFRVAVVCAGAKVILDLPNTLEVLETAGVPVIGVGTLDFPAFYARESGLKLQGKVSDPIQAAKIMHARFDSLGQGGIVFALPPPAGASIPLMELESQIAAASQLAAQRSIQGKALTPFLLSELARGTGGKSLKINLALLEQNAAFAAELAWADAHLQRT